LTKEWVQPFQIPGTRSGNIMLHLAEN